MPFTAGDHLDTYQLVRPLGAGGMGEVWLARDSRLERTVAIKLLPGDLARDPDRLARFDREARAASVLNHPNVCTIYALGESDGRPYIVMEYVDGQTLRQRLAEGPLTLADALGIGIAVASALGAAHAQGIVHRDIKPENIMIRRDALVKVLDFGLAKLLSPSGAFENTTTAASVSTTPGAIAGTVAYMSPEQARGERLDHRTDIWSLGVVFFELVAGQVPFRGKTTTDTLVAILERDTPPLARFAPDVPSELQRIVNKALRKSPDERYQSVRDLLLDLQEYQETLRERRSSPAALAGGPDGRTNGWKRVALVLLVVGVMSAGAALWYARKTSAPAPVGASQPSHAAARPLSRLTFDPGLQTDVTWSHDGRFIAYSSDRSGTFNIWVQAVDGGVPIQVTHSSAPDTQPDWSPTANRIVFRSERDGGGLYIVPALGGNETRLTSTGVEPRWSPDGTLVLFVPSQAVPGVTPAQLQVVGLDGAPPRDVLPNFVFVFAADWHPDGRISVLGVHKTMGTGFFTGHLNGSDLVRSSTSDSVQRSMGAFGLLSAPRFRWDPSGRAVFMEVGDRGIQNLWKIQVDPATLSMTSAERLTTGATRDVRAAVSPDGSRLAYSALLESTRLWTFPLDAASGRITGRGEPFTQENADAGTSDLSGDGRYVVYEIQQAGGTQRELWLADLEKGTTRSIFTIDSFRANPRWARDNRQIAYYRASMPGSSSPVLSLAIGDLDGRERVVMSFGIPMLAQPEFFPFDWTPDGRFLLGTHRISETERSEIALWPVTGPDTSRVGPVLTTNRRYDFWQERFSPDAKYIAFVYVPVQGRGYPSIAFAPADALDESHWQRIGTDQAWSDKPRWSPDGRLLYYEARDAQGRFNVWAVRIANGAPAGRAFRVTTFDRPDLVVSPDVDRAEMGVSAHRLVLPVKKVSGSIWMLDNVGR